MKIKNLLLSTLLLSMVCVSAKAEEADTTPVYIENSYWTNWFVGAGVGALVYFGDGDSSSDFSGRLAPALNLSVGKWINPNIGLRVEYTGIKAKGYTFDEALESVNGSMNSDGSYGQKWTLTNIHADVMFNLSNIIAGYKEDRVYNAIPFAGAGYVHNSSNKVDEIAMTAGLQNSFRISDSFDLNLNLAGTLIKDGLDGETGGKMGEGFATLTVGATYKIKPRGWNTVSTSDVYLSSTATTPSSKYADGWQSQKSLGPVKQIEVTDEEQVAQMRSQIKDLQSENKDLRDQLAQAKRELAECQKSAAGKEAVISSSIVFFEIGSTELSYENRVTLGYVAKSINADETGKKFTVVGYADSATGSAARNDVVSKERAEAVYNALIEEFGVDANYLTIEYKGGVDAMFYNIPALNRAVIIE